MKELEDIRSLLIPIKYRKEITEKVPKGWMVLKKGAYLFAAVPFEEIPSDDFGSKHVKNTIRKLLFSFPIIAEKGLFLLYYGDQKRWSETKERFEVDKTALRPVILQSVHFADFKTGQNYNTRTHWGPVKFGFCGKTIELLEGYFKNLSDNHTLDPTEANSPE